MKYLLLFALLLAIWWRWKKHKAERSPAERKGSQLAPENMLICAHCGVHFPEADGLREDDGVAYCSEAHRQAARTAGRR